MSIQDRLCPLSATRCPDGICICGLSSQLPQSLPLPVVRAHEQAAYQTDPLWGNKLVTEAWNGVVRYSASNTFIELAQPISPPSVHAERYVVNSPCSLRQRLFVAWAILIGKQLEVDPDARAATP